MARADRFTAANKTPIYYSDFLNNLELNPITDQIAVLTNEQAVANSVKNLVLTNFTERIYHPEIGSKIQSLLFEPAGPVTQDLIKTTIQETIQNQERRVKIISLDVQDDPDNSQYLVQLVFSLINISKPISLSFSILRIR